ncbi:replication initiation factor domain-containing protein [Enterococcus casseliflavus]|nr:replication initiation factor domain-containing protein [Enterococcus casseliflavus]
MGNTNKETALQKVINANKNKTYRKNKSQISDVSKNFNAETLYIGSRSRNTNSHLRIYDKKKEQLE